MKISTKELTTPRKWSSMTGMNKEEFYKLLPLFEASYIELNHKTLAKKQAETSTEFCLKSEEELLLFTLISLKCGLTYDALGIFCGMEGSNAKRNQEMGVRVLKKALEDNGDMPKRKFLNKQEFDAHFENNEELLIDATEHRIQRPSDDSQQKEHYSGKKKCHCLKTMVIGTVDRIVKYISRSVAGKVHDYRLLKEDFPPEENWFSEVSLLADSGYTGIDKDYKSQSTTIPIKKPRKAELSRESKEHNKQLSSVRIIIEHIIGGIKRYRVLSDRLRMHDIDLYDDFMGVCAGLWNFCVRN